LASVVAVAATGAIARGDAGGGGDGCSAKSTRSHAWKAEHCKAPTTAGATTSTSSSARTGALDCNGFSKTQGPIKSAGICTDFRGEYGRGTDNGHYIGHDEPTTQFVSTAPGSGNNVQWELTLPRDHSLPAIQNFQNYIAFWFSMALCDVQSYPQGNCTPNSDANNPNEAGSAFLEMQFYPPGFAPFISAISCDTTHWCASLHINSLECTAGFEFCNNDCIEPTNFGWIQRNGVPTGPAGPVNATADTYTPNGDTLLMNPGDRIIATIHDTEHGVMTRIDDLTTGQSGYMVASAANGFQSLNLRCEPMPWDFHPEFDSAREGNYVPWAALQANVGFSMELGHFENGSGDEDDDDAPCFNAEQGLRIIPGCLAFVQGGDIDFDGPSYQEDWANGSADVPDPIVFRSPHTGGDYTDTYPRMQFETTVPASEATCRDSGEGCVVPPGDSSFYPFYSINSDCRWMFGNDIAGQTVNDFGRLAQYGKPNLPWFFGILSSGLQNNPC